MKIIYEMDDDLLRHADHFFTQHFQQTGGYLPYVFTEHGQYGEGFGSFLKGLWRAISPALASGAKSGLKAVGKQALSSGAEYLGDLASGANWREAGQERLREAGRSLGSKLGAKMAGEQSGGFFGLPSAIMAMRNPRFRRGLLGVRKRLLGFGNNRMPTYYNSYGTMLEGPDQSGSGRRRNKIRRPRAQLLSCVPYTAPRRRTTAGRVTRRRGRKRASTGQRRRRPSPKRRAATPQRRRQRRTPAPKRRKPAARGGRRRRRRGGRQQRGGGSDFPSVGWL